MKRLARRAVVAIQVALAAALAVGGTWVFCGTVSKPPGHVGVVAAALELASVVALVLAAALAWLSLALLRERKEAWWLSMALWAGLLLWSVGVLVNGVPEMRGIVLSTGVVALVTELLLAAAY